MALTPPNTSLPETCAVRGLNVAAAAAAAHGLHYSRYLFGEEGRKVEGRDRSGFRTVLGSVARLSLRGRELLRPVVRRAT